MRKLLVIISLALLLAGFNWSAFQKETLRENGDMVLLELAPVDPRALLMGDYMTLDYRMNREVNRALRDAQSNSSAEEPLGMSRYDLMDSLPEDGTVIVRLDDNKVASFMRLDDGSPLAQDEQRLFFRVRNGQVHLAASAYFFQEGYAKDYERARYGELRVEKNGKNLLVHMRDKDLKRIEPEKMKAEKTKTAE